MNYTLIGDPHLTHRSLDRARDLVELVEAIGRPAIWLGDLFDTKEVIRGKCLNFILEYFQRSKLQHVVIVGNHDYFNLDCEDHSLEALKLLHNVIVVDEPMVDGNFVFLPYVHDKAKLKETIQSYARPDRILVAHLELSSFDFGNGHVCTTGLSIEDVAGFKRVISGHFHKYQEQGNLTYLGTPFSHSFGETNQTKYLGMYDSEKDELKIAETPFPRHITYEFNCDNLNESCEHWIFNTDSPAWEKDFYRVILTGSQANIDRFPKYMYEKLNVKWISRPSDHAENQVAIEDTASNEKQFVKWATEIRGMDEETIKLGLSIMEACR